MLGSIGRSHLFGGCNWAELRDPESWRRQNFIKLVGSKSLEGSSTWDRLDFEGIFLFVYSNSFSSGSIYHLEGGGKVFCRVLRILLR